MEKEVIALKANLVIFLFDSRNWANFIASVVSFISSCDIENLRMYNWLKNKSHLHNETEVNVDICDIFVYDI